MRRPDELFTFCRNRLTAQQSQFFRYLLVGGWNTVFGMAVYAGLYQWLGGSVHYLILLIPSNFLAVTNAYVCYRLFVFRTRGNILKEYFRCYVVYGGMMLAGAVLLYVLVDWLGVPPAAANCICVALTTIASYFGHRNFSFKPGPPNDGRINLLHSLDAKPVLILGIASLLTLLCHLTTIKYYPLSWLDEVDIREIGRFSIYNQNPAWSLHLTPTVPASTPTPFIHYLGGFIQETLYRITGNFIVPRCFALGGLLFAVVLFYIWLRKKGFSPWITLFSALLLLSDTNVTVGVHWYRLDMWVMGLTFLNAWLVLRCSGKTESTQLKTLFAVGGIMVFQMIFWLTAIIQWPLVLAEVLTLAVAEKWTLRRYLGAMLSGFSGMLSVGFILLIPLYGELSNTFAYFLTQTEIGCTISRFNPSASVSSTSVLLQSALERLLHFIKLIMRTPFIWVGATIGCCFFWRKHRFHFYALLFSAMLVMMTQVYHARVNYLTPLVFLFFSEGLYQWLTRNSRLRYLAAAFLTIALAYSFLLSVIGLNYFARPLSKGNTYDALLEKMSSTVGCGPIKIYTFTYDIYHVGRKLGWHMFSFLPGKPESIFISQVSKPLLADLDYIVVGDDYELNTDQNTFLNTQGFHPWKRVELPKDEPVGMTALFRPVIYARGYPCFTIWKKATRFQ